MIADQWPASSACICLYTADVHVWLVHLDDPRLCFSCCENLLSPDEKARAGRFRFQAAQKRYVFAHASLRSILSRYVSVPPSALKFLSGPNGKPKLAIDGTESVDFNLSHSHELAVVGISRDRQIGIDIEYVDASFAFTEVAERFFSAAELALLAKLPPDLQREGFYRCWTMKEAILKARGTGLSAQLDRVNLIVTGDASKVTVLSDLSDWTVTELDPGNRYVAAVVVEGKGCDLACYRWEAPTLEHRHA